MALSFQHVFLKALLGWAYLGCTSQKILTIIHALLIQKQGGVLWFLYKENSFVFVFSEWLLHLIIMQGFHLTLSLGVPEFIILSNLYLI